EPKPANAGSWRTSARSWSGCGGRTSTCVGAPHCRSSGGLFAKQTGPVPSCRPVHERVPGHVPCHRALDRRASHAVARVACFSFVEGWYNSTNLVRLHSALRYRSPIRYEQETQTELQRKCRGSTSSV